MWSRHGGKWVKNWLQQKSSHVFTQMLSRSVDGTGAKSALQQMGPTPNFPRPLRNRTPKNLLLPSHTWQICSRCSTIHLPMREQAHGRAAGIKKICPCLSRNHFAHMWTYLYFLCAYWISVYHFISTYMLDTFFKLFHWISNLAYI